LNSKWAQRIGLWFQCLIFTENISLEPSQG